MSNASGQPTGPLEEPIPSRLPAGSIVLVDGHPLRHAIDADLPNSVAWRFDYDSKGRIVRDAAGEPLLIRVKGKVVEVRRD